MASKTNEQFLAESKLKFPQIEVLSEYKSSKEMMTFRCTKHDYVFSKTAHSFINSKCGCNLCADENFRTAKKKTPEWFRNELKSINPNVEQISEYVRMQEKVKVKCVYCGNIFESRAQDLLQGHFCRTCAIKKFSQERTKDHNWFIEELKKYNPNYKNIEIVGNYTGVNHKIQCRCKKCSYEWETKASRLIDKRGGSGCPLCNQSKGEIIVYNYLLKHRIDFEQQKDFSNLLGVSGFPLSYDFYIPSKNLLIEVNGLQHYSPVKYFGGIKKFNIQKEHDKRKRLYAQNNGYRLLEIKCCDSSYFENINKILQTNL